MVSPATPREEQGAPRAPRPGGTGRHDPVFVISVAAEMTGMHPQTLRQYDRLGLVVPQRQGGRHRRYSRADVELLGTVQALSREGVSLEGIRRIVALQQEVERLQETVVELASQVDRLHHTSRLARVFSVGVAGEVSARYDSPAGARDPGDDRAAGADSSDRTGGAGSAVRRPADPARRVLRALPPAPARHGHASAWRALTRG